MSTYEVRAEVTGSIWKIVTQVGQSVDPGEVIMIVESMKMEIPVIAEDGGRVESFKVEEGASVAEGQVVAVMAV